MTNLAERPHALYRFFDSTGALLYVGITANVGARWSAHAYDRPWWSEVASATVEHHAAREAVLAAERTAIRSERPKYNVVHSGGGDVAIPAQRGAERVVALGLHDGRCPVGMVEEWGEWVRLRLFSFISGEFTAGLGSFREADVVEVRDARQMTDAERAEWTFGASAGTPCYATGELGRWQSRWKHAHGLIDDRDLRDTLAMMADVP